MHACTVQAIIDLFRQYKDSLDTDEHELHYPPWNFDDVIAHLENPNRRKLVSLIDNLDAEVRAELMAVMWIGRGEGIKEDFESLKQQAINIADEGDADYMVSKQPYDEYLVEGMRVLGLSVEA